MQLKEMKFVRYYGPSLLYTLAHVSEMYYLCIVEVDVSKVDKVFVLKLLGGELCGKCERSENVSSLSFSYC